MKHESVKEHTEIGKYVMVHTNAHENTVYIGKVKKLSNTSIELCPAENFLWLSHTFTSYENLEKLKDKSSVILI